MNGNQSCQTCHHPAAKFADPENRFKPFLLPVSDGSVPTLFGGRNAPTAAYTKFSPPLFWDGELFIGGLFWDGRASGNVQTATGTLGAGPTGDPLADQVSSLRNIAETAPYGHNGFFAALGDIVNFYNRRDALADAYPDMFAPEVAETVNDGELGNLGLTSRQERRVVLLFLRTLTDR